MSYRFVQRVMTAPCDDWAVRLELSNVSLMFLISERRMITSSSTEHIVFKCRPTMVPSGIAVQGQMCILSYEMKYMLLKRLNARYIWTVYKLCFYYLLILTSRHWLLQRFSYFTNTGMKELMPAIVTIYGLIMYGYVYNKYIHILWFHK